MAELKIADVTLVETATTAITTTKTASTLECRVDSETFKFLQDKCLRCEPVDLTPLGLGKCWIDSVIYGGFSPTGTITLKPIKEI